MSKTNLTPEQQLSDKAKSLKEFVNDCISRSSNVSNDVFTKLWGTDFKTPADPKQSVGSDLLSFAYGFIDDLDFEGSSVVSWLVGGIINHYKEVNENDPRNLPEMLAEDCSDINERIYRTLQQTYLDLAEIQQDPVSHWNDSYNVPFGNKGVVFVNELLNYDIPTNDSRPVDYGNMLSKFRDGLTYTVAKNEIVSRNLYKIGYPLVINLIVGQFQSLIVNPEHCQPGHEDMDWTPLLSSHMPWTLKSNNLSDGNCIINRCPKENGGPAEVFHPYCAKSNPCGESDWKLAATDYMTNICKSSFLNCYTISNMKDGSTMLFYRTFYLIDGRYNYEQESAYGQGTWFVVDNEFCEWLFKDDGFGNIINPNGITTREDVFLNWGLIGSSGVKPPSPGQGFNPFKKFIKRLGYFLRK